MGMADLALQDFGVRRFVVLHHTGVPSPHFDLMFETADESALVSFRLTYWPILQNGPATKLPDHRRAYLDYEGPITHHRGRVDRVASGTARVTNAGPAWRLQPLDGGVDLQLTPSDIGNPDEWLVTVTTPQ